MTIDVYWHLPVLQSGIREAWPYGPATGTFHPSLAIISVSRLPSANASKARERGLSSEIK